jgi:hypothetical protein
MLRLRGHKLRGRGMAGNRGAARTLPRQPARGGEGNRSGRRLPAEPSPSGPLSRAPPVFTRRVPALYGRGGERRSAGGRSPSVTPSPTQFVAVCGGGSGRGALRPRTRPRPHSSFGEHLHPPRVYFPRHAAARMDESGAPPPPPRTSSRRRSARRGGASRRAGGRSSRAHRRPSRRALSCTARTLRRGSVAVQSPETMDVEDGGSRACDIRGSMIRLAVPRAFSVKLNQRSPRAGPSRARGTACRASPAGRGRPACRSAPPPPCRSPFAPFSCAPPTPCTPHDGTLDG